MKNVMIYNIVSDKIRYDNEELFKTFKMQIDNALHYGWKPEDIILGTNFEFEYKGIKSNILTDICTYNIFNNKWYGMYELVKSGVLNDDFWFHDQDNWQIDKLEFPEFLGEIAACTYVRTPEWNTGSVFVKKTAMHILEYIVESMKMNELDYFSDEHWIAYLRANTPVTDYMSTINTQYCVGYTYIDDRLNSALRPVKVIACMPAAKSYSAFLERNLIPLHLQQIFNDASN